MNTRRPRAVHVVVVFACAALAPTSGAEALTGVRSPAGVFDDVQAKWSPTGTAVVFARLRRTGGSGLEGTVFLYRPAAVEQLRAMARGLAPEWSPDGRQIAYWGRVQGRAGLYTLRTAAPARRSLLVRDETAGDPAWSRDGRLIAYQSSGSNDPSVYVVASRGGQPQLIARGAISPDWSPDGTKIIFGGYRPRQAGLYIADLVTARITQLSSGEAFERDPAWSPDGSSILFTRVPRGIYKVPSSGGEAVRLVSGGWPSWSPRQRRILYTSGGRLRVVSSDGGRSRYLTGLYRTSNRRKG